MMLRPATCRGFFFGGGFLVVGEESPSVVGEVVVVLSIKPRENEEDVSAEEENSC